MTKRRTHSADIVPTLKELEYDLWHVQNAIQIDRLRTSLTPDGRHDASDDAIIDLLNQGSDEDIGTPRVETANWFIQHAREHDSSDELDEIILKNLEFAILTVIVRTGKAKPKHARDLTSLPQSNAISDDELIELALQQKDPETAALLINPLLIKDSQDSCINLAIKLREQLVKTVREEITKTTRSGRFILMLAHHLQFPELLCMSQNDLDVQYERYTKANRIQKRALRTDFRGKVLKICREDRDIKKRTDGKDSESLRQRQLARHYPTDSASSMHRVKLVTPGERAATKKSNSVLSRILLQIRQAIIKWRANSKLKATAAPEGVVIGDTVTITTTSTARMLRETPPGTPVTLEAVVTTEEVRTTTAKRSFNQAFNCWIWRQRKSALTSERRNPEAVSEQRPQ